MLKWMAQVVEWAFSFLVFSSFMFYQIDTTTVIEQEHGAVNLVASRVGAVQLAWRRVDGGGEQQLAK
jgi:hypothetical protein